MTQSLKQACVIGYPVAHSKSPDIHRYWLEKYKIHGRYEALTIDPDMFDTQIKHMKKQYVGWNVTLPYKTRMIDHLDRLTPSAASAGAVNTVYKDRDGKWVGDNTDITGIEMTIKGNIKKFKRALVLGAGGAARACVIALKNLGVKEVFISNRSTTRLKKLQSFFPEIEIVPWADVDKKIMDIDLLINATACGLNNENLLPFKFTYLSSQHTVLDIVYIPLKTELLNIAEQRGAKTIDGLWMLLYQATPGFEKWFGQKVSIDDLLREKIERTL